MCVPNLKIVAFSDCEILRGSQNFEIGSRTPGDAHLGANLWSMSKNCPRPICLPNLKIVTFSVCEILRGSQNFEIGARTPGDAQFRANLWSGGQELPTAYVHAKFEARSFIRLRNIGTFRCGALIDPVTLTFDLLTLKSVWKSHVSWGAHVQSFVFLGLLVFELEPMYATSDRRTDRRTDGRRTPMTA